MDFIRPAFSGISPDNHAGYLWIITILGDIYTVLAAFVRIFVKWGLTGIDDYLLGLATVSLTNSHMLYPLTIGS